MKILITSDIHYNLKNLEKIKTIYPNYYHLDAGDSVLPNNKLNELEITSVRGNCDYNYQLPLIKIVEINDLKILLSHGHLLAVKKGLTKLIKVAMENKVNVVIYGHTHQPYLNKINNLTVINPGSLNEGNYAIFENNKFSLKEL